MTQLVVVPQAIPTPLPVPHELVIRGKENTVAYACLKCGQLFIFGKEESVESRHQKRDEAATHCVKQCICGKPLDFHYWLRCADCRIALDAAKEKAYFDKATKLSIEEYPDNPVFWEEHGGDMGCDGYFSNVDTLLDFAEDRGIDLPEYVWACTRHDLKLDAEGILQSALEQQDMDPDNVDIPTSKGMQLQAFLDAWTKELGAHAWFQDCLRAVILREGASFPPPAA